MKKINLFRLIILLLLVFNYYGAQKNKSSLEYQNDNLIQNLGIGLVQIINFDKKLVLYSDNKLSKIKYINPKIGDDFVPILNKPDYGILFLTCLESKNKIYKLAISKNEYAYVKASSNINFYSWNDFLKNKITSIESKDINNNPPRTSIRGKTIDIKKCESDDEIKIIEIKNHWIKVKNITQDYYYWIKWRDNKTLKIYLNLLI